MHILDHLIMFILGVVVPLRSWQSAQAGDLQQLRFDSRAKKIMYYSNGALLWALALVVLAVWWGSGRSFDLLGLGAWAGTLPTLGWVIIGVFTLLYVGDLVMELASHAQQKQSKEELRQNISFLPATGREYFHYLFLAISAGICEEIVFRGYFIRYFQWVLGWESLAAIGLSLLLPAIAFGIPHLYQGWQAVVKIVAMALMFGTFFLLTGTLWPLIIVHAAIDIVGGFVSYRLMQR